MANENFILVDSVDVYNKAFGLDTLHPLVSVVDLSKATKTLRRARMHYGVYALFLKHGKGCALHYGRQKYDYQEGTVVSFAPGQVVDIEFFDEDPAPEALGLLFHPDLIYGTPLAERIRRYTFFEYSECETGITAQRYIQNKVIDLSKQYVLDGNIERKLA